MNILPRIFPLLDLESIESSDIIVNGLARIFIQTFIISGYFFQYSYLTERQTCKKFTLENHYEFLMRNDTAFTIKVTAYRLNHNNFFSNFYIYI